MSYQTTDDCVIEISYENESEGYDWSTTVLYYHTKARRYFLESQGGCSCNAYEGPYGPLDNYETWSREEALRHLTGEMYDDLRNFQEPK